MSEPYHALELAHALYQFRGALLVCAVFFGVIFLIEKWMEDENEPT